MGILTHAALMTDDIGSKWMLELSPHQQPLVALQGTRAAPRSTAFDNSASLAQRPIQGKLSQAPNISNGSTDENNKNVNEPDPTIVTGDAQEDPKPTISLEQVASQESNKKTTVLEDELNAEQADHAAAVVKDVDSALKKIQSQSRRSRALLIDVGTDASTSEVQHVVGQVAQRARAVPQNPGSVHAALQKLYEMRNGLSDSMRYQPIAGQPYTLRSSLARLAFAADRANTSIMNMVEPARKALEAIFGVDEQGNHPHIFEDDILISTDSDMAAQDAPPIITSSGCACLDGTRCASRGQPFSWCPVSPDPSECYLGAAAQVDPSGLVQDPSGQSHILTSNRDEDGSLDKDDTLWDYCVPPEASVSELSKHPDAEKTVHSNCRCEPREDVFTKYAADPEYLDDQGLVDLDRVPFRDRFTVEIMLHDKEDPTGSICTTTPSSQGFHVCPVARDCAEPGVGGPSPGHWFAGVGKRSWDFCVPPLDAVNDVSESEPQEANPEASSPNDEITNSDIHLESVAPNNGVAKKENFQEPPAAVTQHAENKPSADVKLRSMAVPVVSLPIPAVIVQGHRKPCNTNHKIRHRLNSFLPAIVIA